MEGEASLPLPILEGWRTSLLDIMLDIPSTCVSLRPSNPAKSRMERGHLALQEIPPSLLQARTVEDLGGKSGAALHCLGQFHTYSVTRERWETVWNIHGSRPMGNIMLFHESIRCLATRPCHGERKKKYCCTCMQPSSLAAVGCSSHFAISRKREHGTTTGGV